MASLPPPQPAAAQGGPPDPSGHFCPNCGAPITPHETACRYCGEQLAPFFAPQVGRARRGGMERGMLFALIGCGGLTVLALVGLMVLFVSALFAQGGNSENGYSCSPGPCAVTSQVDLKVTRVTTGTLPAGLANSTSGKYLGLVIRLDVSGTETLTVTPDDFGLVDKAARRLPRVSGFSGCPTWTELPASGDGVQLPVVCYAVGETNLGDYKMTWSRLQPGQQISLFVPHRG